MINYPDYLKQMYIVWFASFYKIYKFYKVKSICLKIIYFLANFYSLRLKHQGTLKSRKAQKDYARP